MVEQLPDYLTVEDDQQQPIRLSIREEQLPMYLTVKEAAQYVGISEKIMYQLLSGANPPPYITFRKKKLVRRSALPAYFEALEER